MDKLCIFGTRTFYDNPEARQIIQTALRDRPPDVIVTCGDADGVCKLAIDVARETGIICELHWLRQDKYAAGMFEHRSKETLASSTRVLFIHDGASKGTLNEMKQAEAMGLPSEYHRISDYPKYDFDLNEIKKIGRGGIGV